MNTTYYFFCDCGFGQPVHHKEEEAILVQCPTCRTINSKKPTSKQVYVVCNHCKEQEEIPLGGSFYQNNEHLSGKVCKACGRRGFVQHDKGLEGFCVELHDHIDESCDGCKKNRWNLAGPNKQAQDFYCPSCYGFLQQRTSSTWEDNEETEEGQY